jgi:hypothetical protein
MESSFARNPDEVWKQAFHFSALTPMPNWASYVVNVSAHEGEGHMVSSHDLVHFHLDKPDDLIFSPQLVSQAASYMLNAMVVEERINPREINEERRVPISDIRFMMKAERSHNTEFLSRVLEELVSMKIKWGELLNEGVVGDGAQSGKEEGVPPVEGDRLNVIVPFLQKAAYRSRSDGTVDPERGYIIYKLSDPIFEIIKAKRSITQVQVLLQRSFELPYSFKLYEVFSHLLQKRPGEDFISIIYHVTYLRQLLGMEDRYPVFADFNKFILKPNIEEVNKRADFTVEMKALREKRVIYAIEFTATRKRDFQLQLDLPSEDRLPKLLERALQASTENQERERIKHRLLNDYKISKLAAEKYIESLGLDVVEGIIAKIQSDFDSGYKPRSRTAYVKSCLDGDSIPGEYAMRMDVPEAARPVYRILIQRYEFSEAQARKLAREFPAEQIESALEYVEFRRAKGDHKGGDFGNGYIVSAITDDYGKRLRERKAQDEEEAAEARRKREAREREIAKLRDEFEALPEAIQAKLIKEFRDNPPSYFTCSVVAQDDFRKNGITGAHAGSMFFRQFFASHKLRRTAA